MLDIRLMTFLTLAKTKNYTRAGELLNLTQPAVSQHIKFLEDYYGLSLINKQERYIFLTDAGKILYKYAEELERLYKNIELDLESINSVGRKYTIGATMTIGGYVLPQLLAEYKDSYKNIDITLQVHNTEEIIDCLLKRNLDLAVVEGSFDITKFKYKRLKQDELVLAISPKHPFAKKYEVELGEIFDGDLILREKGSGTRQIFEDKLSELGFDIKEIKPHMELGSISAIKSLVELNLGYTIISRESIKKEQEAGTIITLPIRDVRIYRDFNFVYLDNMNLEFIEHFMNYCLMKQ